jgi:hypothetical protein
VLRLYESDGRRMVDLELICRRDNDQAVIVQAWMAYDLGAAE